MNVNIYLIPLATNVVLGATVVAVNHRNDVFYTNIDLFGHRLINFPFNHPPYLPTPSLWRLKSRIEMTSGLPQISLATP